MPLPLEHEILRWIDAVWHYEPHPYDNPYNVFSISVRNGLWHQTDHVLHPALVESIDRLRARWPDEELTRHVADVFFIPALYWQYRPEDQWRARVVNLIVNTWLEEFMLPPDIIRRVEDVVVVVHTTLREQLSEMIYRPAHLAMEYLDILRLAPDSPELFDLLERIVRGDTLETRRGVFKRLTFTPTGEGLSTLAHLERLHRAGRLEYDLFRAAMQYNPRLIYAMTTVLQYGENYLDISQWRGVPFEFVRAMQPFTDRLAEELAANITEDNYAILKHFANLMDSKWLWRAAGLHQRLGMKALEWKRQSAQYDRHAGADTLVIHMAQAKLADIDTAEKRQQLVEALRAFPAATLKYLLPVAEPSRDALLAALGWEDCAPLIAQMSAVSGVQKPSMIYSMRADIPNCGDPRSGTVDVAAVRQAFEQAGEKRVKEIFTLFRKAKIGMTHTITLFEALAGWNREKVLKSLGKRNQRYIKAYGLLPLENGDDEVLERYTFIQQYARESKRFGPERQINERAAAQAALNNLAQVAGYRDRERLEWAMEARLAEKVAATGRQWRVEDYTVELVMGEGGPQLIVTRDGKLLKSVPKAVRQSDDYETMKAAKAQLQEQQRRFRAVFEQAMSTGESFSLADLENLNRMPIARALLSKLILCLDPLTTGLYLPDQRAIETLQGNIIAIDQPVLIAHPYHLFHSEELASWQQAIIKRRIVQPFKQAFRELYLLTPAEEETRLYSNRFAGHGIGSAVAARLLQARDWEITSMGDFALPQKFFRPQGIEARFNFPDVGHFFNETPVVTSDQISFHVYPNNDGYRYREENMIPLIDVPPLIFSETMRDADLIVSVAQRDEHALLSNESYQRRGELVTTLLDDLGLPGVRIDGHFACVQGKLARYRVHLGSAAIHIEPGNYLCIVPQRWGQGHEKLFLPFTDSQDSKISEIISKVLLLLADDKIKDESILRQIKRITTDQPT